VHPEVVGTSSRLRRARRRAGAALAAWCLGLWLGWTFSDALAPAPLFALAAPLAALALLALLPLPRSRPLAAACILVAITLAGMGWSVLRLANTRDDALSRVLHRADNATQSQPVLLRLTLLEEPRLSPRDDGSPAWVVRARVRGIVDADATTHHAVGIVWLRAPGESTPPWSAGARVVARGTFRPISPPRNPGEFDLRRWAMDRGLEGGFFPASPLAVRPDESPTTVVERTERRVRAALGAIRARAQHVIASSLSDADQGTGQLVRGLLLGEDPQAPLDEVRAFYRVGLAHILTISGFHLAVFAGAVLFVVRLFGDFGRMEPLLVAACLGLFLVIVPPSSPTLRAAIIVLVLLAGNLVGRRYDRLTLLLWTAVLMLIWRPSELWSLGFQLSFGLTAALLALTGQLESRLFPPRLGHAAMARSPARSATRWWRSTLAASLVCWLVSAPWLIVQMGVVNPLALITGILVTPLVSMLLWLGYGAVLLGMLLPDLASYVGSAAATLARAAGWLVVGADAMPGASIRLPWVSPLWGLAATCWLVIWLLKPRLRRGTMLVLGLGVVVWLGVELAFSESLPPQTAIKVSRLDVGSAPDRCVLIRSQTTNVLIGTGGLSPRSLSAITRELGATRLDAIVLETAPQADMTAWLRPGRTIVLKPNSEFETAAAALQALGLEPAATHLQRTPGSGLQVVLLPTGPTSQPAPTPTP
jgi:ComEC/Rec2-related protein